MYLIVCFCLESLLMLITLSSVREREREGGKKEAKLFFSANTNALTECKHEKSPPPSRNPHLSARCSHTEGN